MRNIISYIITVLFLAIAMSCNQDAYVLRISDVSDFQGFWHDTIRIEGKTYLEELSVDNYTMVYFLKDLSYNILIDKQEGVLMIGNDNKIGWYCSSPITNDTRETFWAVRNVTQDRLGLFSVLYGDHEYKRVYRTSIDEYVIEDTLLELQKYYSLLPMSQNEVIFSFGDYNRLNNNEAFSYLLDHPFINQLSFNDNYDNNSIYSCTFAVNNLQSIYRIISEDYFMIQENNGITDYSDSQYLKDANIVISVDTTTSSIRLSSLRDYDYWPNVSHYIGTPMEVAKNDYSDFIYYYYEYPQIGNMEYDYRISRGGICSHVSFMVDSTGIVRDTGVLIREEYADIDTFLKLLHEKYIFNEYKDGKYYYYPSDTVVNSQYKVEFNPEKFSVIYRGL